MSQHPRVSDSHHVERERITLGRFKITRDATCLNFIVKFSPMRQRVASPVPGILSEATQFPVARWWSSAGYM